MNFKKRLLTIILSLASIFCYAQADSVIVIPTEIGRQMFKDVKERDQLRFELNKKDSIITMYALKDSLYKEEIRAYKLNASSYEKIVSSLEHVDEIRQEQLTDKNKEIRRAYAIGVVELIIIILLII